MDKRPDIRTKDEAGNEVEEGGTVLTFDFTPPTFAAPVASILCEWEQPTLYGDCF